MESEALKNDMCARTTHLPRAGKILFFPVREAAFQGMGYSAMGNVKVVAAPRGG
ncbi:MAG: hypothetical protein KDB86_01680 [Actinobacteria bacterium]|nr:hypothetical protein [Actinomycetota bacterium]MCB9390826.1 hypothetical protein [Acidimicrobiia bacterium]